MIRFSYARIAFYLLMGLVLVACVQTTSPSDANINMALEMLPDPPIVGESELAITLTDQDGAPITDAKLEIVGDMNHAGMVPVVRDLEAADEDGIYRVPFEWTMGGDWFITLFAILQDGTEVEQTFDMTVAMDDEAGMDHGDADHGEMDHSEMNSDADEVHSEEEHSEEMDHDGDNADESHDEENHSEEVDHDDGDSDAADESHDKDDDSEGMDHSHSSDEHDSQTIDTSALHALDEAARDGTIGPEALSILQAFGETLNGLPDEYTADIEAFNVALVDFETAMDAEDMETATTRISEMHDMAHDVKMRLTSTDGEDESAEDDGHEHAHD